MAITTEQLETSLSDFLSKPALRLSQNAVTRSSVKEVAARHAVTSRYNNEYSNRAFDSEMKATNQKSSGRCWLFACLNVLRLHMRKRYNLPASFELSQTYLFFYDKLEKANYFLENILATLDKPEDGRLLAHLLTDPLCDGGQYDMIVNLVEKYGVVPKAAYPDSESSCASVLANRALTQQLRECACRIRTAHAAGESSEALRAIKSKYMQHIHHMMLVHFGTPPATVDWCFHDKDKKEFKEFVGLTPQAFYKDVVQYDLNDCVSMTNDPRNAYSSMLTVQYLGNVVGGVRETVRHLNVDVGTLRKLAMAMIDDGEPVWFGCDVGKEYHRDMAVMDSDLFDWELVYGCKPDLSKAERLRFGQSLMTHAMVLTAYDKRQGEERPKKWRVENSWGEDRGDKGYYMMTDPWFDEYLYQIVVPKRFLSEEQKATLESEAKVLPAWDPMGALA